MEHKIIKIPYQIKDKEMLKVIYANSKVRSLIQTQNIIIKQYGVRLHLMTILKVRKNFDILMKMFDENGMPKINNEEKDEEVKRILQKLNETPALARDEEKKDEKKGVKEESTLEEE